MSKHRPPKNPDLIIGPLPIDAINRTLGTELEAGDVILTRGAQRHAYKRHPEDYPKCLPHLAGVIANPQCVPKTKSERIDDEVRPGWRVN
jgi:hypothetical protein